MCDGLLNYVWLEQNYVGFFTHKKWVVGGVFYRVGFLFGGGLNEKNNALFQYHFTYPNLDSGGNLTSRG
ncbi:MAG: hypothetical protein RLQ12_00335 [Cyclobacteriaceae bacterium]